MPTSKPIKPVFSQERAEELFPGAIARLTALHGSEGWTYRWTHPNLQSTDITGIMAIHGKGTHHDKMFVYFKGSWRTL